MPGQPSGKTPDEAAEVRAREGFAIRIARPKLVPLKSRPSEYGKEDRMRRSELNE